MFRLLLVGKLALFTLPCAWSGLLPNDFDFNFRVELPLDCEHHLVEGPGSLSTVAGAIPGLELLKKVPSFVHSDAQILHHALSPSPLRRVAYSFVLDSGELGFDGSELRVVNSPDGTSYLVSIEAGRLSPFREPVENLINQVTRRYPVELSQGLFLASSADPSLQGKPTPLSIHVDEGVLVLLVNLVGRPTYVFHRGKLFSADRGIPILLSAERRQRIDGTEPVPHATIPRDSADRLILGLEFRLRPDQEEVFDRRRNFRRSFFSLPRFFRRGDSRPRKSLGSVCFNDDA